MRKFLSLLLLTGVCVAAHADPVSGIVYAGGTLPTPAPGAQVTLDLSSPDALILHAESTTIRVPWSSITRWGCFRQNKHRLGVLPTIAAGMFAARIHDHYFDVSWLDADGHTQAILLQIPRDLPKTIHVVLDAHASCAAQRTFAIEGAVEE
jgi:hypothetical protein